MRPTPLILITLILAVAAAACSSDDSTSAGGTTGESADRTIEIEMQDNKYVPDSVSVEAGETIRFVFTNDGDATHDAFIGDEAAQMDHEDEMNGGMAEHGMGADSDAITVKPGDTGELTHTFTDGDTVLIACHEPGHFDAGMRLNIVIS
jgi:uncharacterized cupredoxin-like copper-binding protein